MGASPCSCLARKEGEYYLNNPKATLLLRLKREGKGPEARLFGQRRKEKGGGGEKGFSEQKIGYRVALGEGRKRRSS